MHERQLHGFEMYIVLFFIYLDFCIRSDDPSYPYGSGVQGTESQIRRNHHPGHQNATPAGDEAHKQPRTRGRKRRFVWKVTGYTECTKTCGGGEFYESVFYLCWFYLILGSTLNQDAVTHRLTSRKRSGYLILYHYCLSLCFNYLNVFRFFLSTSFKPCSFATSDFP